MLTRRSWLIGTGTTALASVLTARKVSARSAEPFSATPERLRVLARRGLANRLGGEISQRYLAQLEHELSAFEANPLAVRKLLVLHEVVTFAWLGGIEIGPGRGASPSSLVCWALGITEIDPVRHDLVFERFYDPTSKHDPFIDLEVCQRRRDELVDYLIARHGADHVGLERHPLTDLEPVDDPALWGESRKVLVAQTSLGSDATFRGRWPTIGLGTWERHDCVTFELIGHEFLTDPLCDEGFPEVLQRVRPQSFEELAAAIALYRPGPVEAGWVDYYVDAKHRRRTIDSLPPIAARIVAPTYGLIVYQEQLIRILAEMTGMSLLEANRTRRDLGARRELDRHRAEFVARAACPDATALFDRLQRDAAYTFCRAHALSLATLALRSVQRVV